MGWVHSDEGMHDTETVLRLSIGRQTHDLILMFPTFHTKVAGDFGVEGVPERVIVGGGRDPLDVKPLAHAYGRRESVSCSVRGKHESWTVPRPRIEGRWCVVPVVLYEHEFLPIQFVRAQGLSELVQTAALVEHLHIESRPSVAVHERRDLFEESDLPRHFRQGRIHSVQAHYGDDMYILRMDFRNSEDFGDCVVRHARVVLDVDEALLLDCRNDLAISH